MTQTLLGIALGIATSFVVGIILIWKGDQIVRGLRLLPTKRRVKLYSRAYLTALKSYPYRYAHLMGLTTVSMVILTSFIAYIYFTFLAFSTDFSASPEEFAEALKAARPNREAIFGVMTNPWLLLGLTCVTGFVGRKIIFTTIPVELLVPYAHRELTRLRECVNKCSTKKQFLEYTDAEHRVYSLEDLVELVGRAKRILGDTDFALADEILEGVTEDFPELRSAGLDGENTKTANKRVQATVVPPVPDP